MNSFPIQPPAPAPKKSYKTWIIVGVVLLVLCCLCTVVGGGGGYYYYLYGNKLRMGIIPGITSPTAENNQQAAPESPAQPGPISPQPGNSPQNPPAQPPAPQVSTAGKEIKSDKGGYAFMPVPNYDVTINDTLSPGAVVLDASGSGDDRPNITLLGWANTKYKSAEEMATYLKPGRGPSQKQVLSAGQQAAIAGVNGLAVDEEYELPGIGKMKGRTIYVLVNPKQCFIIKAYSPTDQWDKTLADLNMVIGSVSFSGSTGQTQTQPTDQAQPQTPTQPAASQVKSYITKITLAKGVQGNEKSPLNPTTTFGISDPFYVVLEIDNPPSGTTYQGTWYAVNATGVAANAKIGSAEYTPTKSENVYFYTKPTKTWPVGSYRVDIAMNGQIVQSVEFSVK